MSKSSNDREKIVKRRQRRRKRRLKTSFKLFVAFFVILAASGGYVGYMYHQAKTAPDPYGKMEDIRDAYKSAYDLEDETKPEAKYWVLNVGNGEAIYVQCEQTDILIDTGSAEDGKAIIDTIKGELHGSLDYLIITSTSPRRIGGLEAVCKEFKPTKVITCDLGKSRAEMVKKIGPDSDVSNGEDMTLSISDGAFLSIFLPEVSSSDALDQSLMTYFSYGDTGFFAESDAGVEEEARVIEQIVKCNVIVLARAGSDQVNQLVGTLSAQYLIASTDKESGGPSEALMDSVTGAFYTTYESGTIKFSTNGTDITSNLEN